MLIPSNVIVKLRSIFLNAWMPLIVFLLGAWSYFQWDRAIVDFFSLHPLAQSIRIPALILSFFSEQTVMLSGLFLLGCFFRYLRPKPEWERKVWFVFWSVFFPNIIALGLKIVLGRARPELWVVDHFFGFYGLQWHAPYWSFPSGHVTTMTAFSAALWVLLPRYALLWSVMMVSIMMVRVLLLKHYLSDVVVTFYLTWLEMFLIWKGLLR